MQAMAQDGHAATRKGRASGALLLLLVMGLAACAGDEENAPAPRPVLVERAGAAAAAAASAFAGEVRAREESTLAFRVAGKLVRRHVDVGDVVKRGDLLAELDPGDLRLQAGAAQAQLAAAQAELARANADRARYAALAQQQLVSQSSLDAIDAAHAAAAGQVQALRAQAQLAGNQAAYTQLRAPTDGVIAARQAEAGQVVGAGQPVFTLAGAQGREIAIALPENRIRDFSVGQSVVVALWSAPGRRLQGTIREIAPAADPQTRTYAARVALHGAAAAAVELGQSAQVLVPDDRDGARLSVPLAALQAGNGHGDTAVWVVDPATRKVHLAPVQAGPYGETRVPVLDGLAPDALVVAAGGHLLREGERVTPVDRDNRPVLAAGP